MAKILLKGEDMAQQIHWFPGHMNKALNEVENKVKLVDVVIELLDARAPLSSINENLEKVIQNKKKLIVLTKIDLADSNATKEWIEGLKKRYDAILTLDLKNNNAESILSKAVIALGKDKWAKEMAKGMKHQPIRTMIIGIPNVGKSSLINRLAKRKQIGESMMDYEKIVKTIIDPIVEDSDSVLLRVNEEEKDVLIIIAAEKDDTARLIGRKGIIANAIREVVSVAGKSEEKHVHLKFESFDDEKKED